MVFLLFFSILASDDVSFVFSVVVPDGVSSVFSVFVSDGVSFTFSVVDESFSSFAPLGEAESGGGLLGFLTETLFD